MFVVLVISALREPFLSRFHASQATWDWFESRGIKVIKVVGDPSLRKPQFMDNVLCVPVKDEWAHIGLKVWWAVSYMIKDSSVEGVFKLDDDVQINSSAEAERAIHILSKHDYASLGVGVATKGIPITYAQTRVADTNPWKLASVFVPDTVPYASGSFMYLSRTSMEILTSVHSLVAFSQSPLEDVTTGQTLCKHMIPLTVLTSSAFQWGHLDKTVGSSEDDFKSPDKTIATV